jgi:alpha-N-arabinofuranosidase
MCKRLIVALLFMAAMSLELSAAASISIDIKKQSAPISPYIYGQFIEHLGRCIYGGLWAEMLEDRKFYFPVKDNYNPWASSNDPYWKAGEYKYLDASPWKVIGPPNTVSMDSINAWVGEHSPLINLPTDGSEAGISQDGLAVVKNKTYQGRIILSGNEEAQPVIIRLILNEQTVLQQEIKNLCADFQKYEFSFTAPLASDQVRIEIVSRGTGKFSIGTLSLMPADNIDGWRRDVLDMLKELNSPVYRWPGGNFVSGYNWRDGIGKRDKRPPRKNPAWKGVEHNDVGIDEFMVLMKLIDSEAYIAVNTGLGTVQEVTEEVEYCNGAAYTPQGKLRAANGHPAPYNVKWWAVGNEMYGKWQLGYMPLERYLQKHIDVAKEMWRVDPTIKLVGVGSVGEWSKMMLKTCADFMNLISEHIYCQEKPDVREHLGQLAAAIHNKAEAHRQYRREISEISAKNIQIAMDEWNYWYGDYIYGEIGVRYHHY